MNREFSSILEALKTYAELTPDKLCVCDKRNKVTYKQFWNMLRSGAAYLKNSGVKKGDVVVFKGAQKVEYLFEVFSIQLLGAVACPLEKAVKEDRILEIMDFVDSKIFLDNKSVKQEDVNNISLKQMFKEAMDEAKQAAYEEFEMPKEDDLSEILFTTGTTGKSKGIEIIYRNNIAIAQNVSESIGICADDVELVTAPLNHSMALRRTYSVFYKGGTVVLTDGVKFIEDFYKLIEQYNITGITFAPAILEQVLKFSKDRFGKYKEQFHYIQLGSAPLSEASKETLRVMFPKTKLLNIYGATESGCTVCLDFSKYGDKQKSIGKPNVNAEILFVDDDRNVVESTEENPGSLAFKGPMNMRGYFNEPVLTAEVLDDKGIIYTNDLGYMGEDGFVYLLGRKGDVINMGGIKIAPAEIEEVVATHEMIKECAVIPISDEITGEAPKLFVVINEGYEYEQKALSKFMMDKLEAIKVPKVIQVIDALPRTFNGKVIKRKLKEMNE